MYFSFIYFLNQQNIILIKILLYFQILFHLTVHKFIPWLLIYVYSNIASIQNFGSLFILPWNQYFIFTTRIKISLNIQLLQHWKNHYSHGQKTFQMCIIRKARKSQLLVGMLNIKSAHAAGRWEVTRHRRIKFLSILTEARYPKSMCQVDHPSFVKQQQQKKNQKSTMAKCQSRTVSQYIIGLTNADQQSYQRLGSKQKTEWKKSGT